MNGAGEVRLASKVSRRVSAGVANSRAIAPDRNRLEAFMLREEPPSLSEDDFREFLMSCAMSRASDVTIQSDQQPRAEIDGVNYRAARRPWSPAEVDRILAEVHGGANARAEINARRVLDFSYELNLPGGARQRFRVNATGIHARDGHGVEISLRVLPTRTPDPAEVGLEAIVVAAMKPRNGIVVVSGGTGSGKSATLAAVVRSHLEDANRPAKIVDIQAPIEYTFRDVAGGSSGSSSLIGQSEVGRHLDGFADGVRSALRRKPDIIVVGEARDLETISASLEASLTGHLVYATTHANDVPDAIRRLLAAFPAVEREARAFDLIASMRFCMAQHLLPRIDGPGRVAAREYVRFTPRLKEKLAALPVADWASVLRREVSGEAADDGPGDMRQSLRDSLSALLRLGAVSREDALALCGPVRVGVGTEGAAA